LLVDLRDSPGMVVHRRQTFNDAYFDDQSPQLWGNYLGNWTRYIHQAMWNSTFTQTLTPGASLSLTFSGSEVWVYSAFSDNTDNGGLVANNIATANYVVDGVSDVSHMAPYFDSSGLLVYYQTAELPYGTHTINITVTGANSTSPFALDFILVSSRVTSTSMGPSSTSSTVTMITHSGIVGPIIGGVLGSIAGIALLAIAAYYFLSKRLRGAGRRRSYFRKSGRADVLAGEALLGSVEPFDATPISPFPFSNSDSNHPLNPFTDHAAISSDTPQHTQSSPDEAGPTYVSNTSAQPRNGKAALLTQLYGIVTQPVQHRDSGTRFTRGGEQGAGPSQPPTDVPPTYTPH